MRFLAAMVLTTAVAGGCSFHPAELDAQTTTEHDAPVQHDAPAEPDAPSAASCHFGVDPATAVSRGVVGLSTGGATHLDASCPGTTSFMGLALDMSTGPVNGQDDRSAHGMRVGCADVGFDAGGGHTGLLQTMDVDGVGGSGFTPSQLTAVARCPAGTVLSGVHAHGTVHQNLFDAATLICTGYDANGSDTSLAQVVVVGSGSDTLSASAADCNAGEQVAAMTAHTGAGLDAIELFCAHTICK